MADIKDGFSLTKKVGQDLLTVQGTDFETFKTNVVAMFGPDAGNEVLAGFVPNVNAQQVQAAITPNAEPVVSAPSANGDAATQKQQDFIWKVAGEQNLGRQEVLSHAASVTGRAISTVSELSKKEASALIDALKG